MGVTVTCPNCGVELSAPARAIGHRVRCIACGKRFRAGEPPGAVAAPHVLAAAMPRGPRLSSCPDCGVAVSRSAPECPGCGCAFEGPWSEHLGPPHIQTIERTGKFWKVQLLISGLMTVAGAALCSCSCAASPPAAGGAAYAGLPLVMLASGAALAVVGFFWFVGARIGAWWDHG